jgi:hypothetical protein
MVGWDQQGAAVPAGRRGQKGISLVFLFFFFLPSLCPAQDCASQNLFFPLGQGFTWDYRITAVDEDGRKTFTSRVACTMGDFGSSTSAGTLFEAFSGLPLGMSCKTAFKLEKGAVYTTEPAWDFSFAAEGFSGHLADPGGLPQLYLPAMDALSVGSSWSRTGGILFAVQAKGVSQSLKGTYQEQNQGLARVEKAEKVTVPYGEFMALKVQATWNVQMAGVSAAIPSVLWFVPGVGLVKEMTLDGTYLKELTGYQVRPCCGFVALSAEGGARVDGKPAAPGMGISGTSRVSVPQGGRLDLATADGNHVRLEGGTEVELQVVCEKTTPDPPKDIITIVKGKALMIIGQTFSGKKIYEVRTPTAVVGVRGTEFSVEVTEASGRARTVVEVLRGEVWVRKNSDGSEVVLAAGSRAAFD